MRAEQAVVLTAAEFQRKELNMPATSADISRQQSLSPFQGSVGESRHETLSTSGMIVPDSTLYRLAAVAGAGSALILLINAAKRSALIATTDLTQLLAPLAEIMALGLVTGLYLAFGRRAGLFGLLAFVAHFISLASLEGIEVVINLVFSKLPMETIAELLAGPLKLVLTATSLLFLFSTLAFVISLGLRKRVPLAPLALYFIGAVPISLRAFVPELALDLGLVSLAAGAAWLAGWLWTSAGSNPSQA